MDDLISWKFAPASVINIPDHLRWRAYIDIKRRYKLRGFPDLTSAPVVALCHVSIGVGSARVHVCLFHRDRDDEYTAIERELFEQINSRDPLSIPAIDQHHRPPWPGTEWFWTLDDPDQAAVEGELTFLDSIFSAIRAK